MVFIIFYIPPIFENKDMHLFVGEAVVVEGEDEEVGHHFLLTLTCFLLNLT